MFGYTKVKMVCSVGADHVAGRSYYLRSALADKYIARGYAEGSLSRKYTESEISELRRSQQIVGV